SELDPGWYVIYEHDSLVYCFGPILLESTGKDYLEQLTGIVEAAVAQRPGITGYQLKLSYEPLAASARRPSNAEPATPPPSAPPPAPPPQPSIWTFFKRLFGFGN